MSANFKIAIVGLVLAAVAAAVMYFFYYSTDSYALLNEAEELRDRGEIYAAHEKAEEALKNDMLNRRAIALKSQLYQLVQNDTNFNGGMEAYEQGKLFLRRNELQKASEEFAKSIKKFNSIPRTAEQYELASAMVLEVMKLEKEVLSDISQESYSNAMWLYRNGELGRAYEQLRQAPNETAEIRKLKSEIVYTMGIKRYDEIMENPGEFGQTYYNDAYYWLEQVPKDSINYDDARKMIKDLEAVAPQ